MEQHPVPQNITTFQFRLIGDMTIKQFGYLAGGIILAYIFYKLPLPFFFTWPMAVIAAFTGFGFAFVPIEERPMDVWVFSFLKNVYNPTLFHWEHTEPLPEPPKSLIPPMSKVSALHMKTALPTNEPKTPGGTIAVPVKSDAAPAAYQKRVSPAVLSFQKAADTKQPSPMDSFFFFIDNLFVTKPKAPPAYVVLPQSRPTIPAHQTASQSPQQFTPQYAPGGVFPSVTGKKIESPSPQKTAAPKQQPQSAQTQKTEEHLDRLKTQLETVQKQLSEKTTEEHRFLELQKQLTELMAERQKMEKELSALRSKVQSQPSSQPLQFRPAGIMSPQKQNEPTVKIMNPDVATRAGLPRLTTFPNVVTGIVKDTNNNLLPGVLVTVKDKEGVPLRALKTNKLGQFAASTQLANGTYMVEVEDPRERFLFDRVQITLNSTVMPALQIVAKSKRSLERDRLVKEIFGSPNAST